MVLGLQIKKNEKIQLHKIVACNDNRFKLGLMVRYEI